MYTFIYDFKENKTVNPLEGITHFYITPYDMEIWKSLSLGDKIEEEDVELVIQESTGLPVIILPISILGLTKCIIKLNDDTVSGKLIMNNGRRTIYFTNGKRPNTICISGLTSN